MESNSNFKYYAFISYSHEDEEFAKRIQKKLTEYKLPSVIQKANPLLPNNVRPIFRDATNLTTGMLQGTLHSELEHSKFLIVLCSQNSAKPNDENKHWVNNEVQHFVDIGRAEYIIPVIVGGEPHAKNPEEECFCPALLSLPGGDELLGIDIRKNPKKKITFGKSIKRKLGIPDEDDLEEKGIVHIIAKMLGLDIDDLWDWNKKAQKRKAYTRLFITAVCFVVMLSTGLTIYFKKIHIYHEYYVDYVDKWGSPVGIGKITRKQKKSLNSHYRFDYQNEKIQQIVFSNGLGTPLDGKLRADNGFLSDPAIIKYIYTDKKDKELIRKEYYNSYNIKFCDLQKKDDERYDELYEVSTYLYDFNNSEEPPSCLEYLIYQRNEDGYITEIKSVEKDFSENPVKYDISRIRYILNENGSINELEYYNDYGKATIGRGIHKIKFEYDSEGYMISQKHYSEDDELLYNKEGVKEYKYEYEKGNQTKLIFYDDGNISYNNKGFAQIGYFYDKSGLITEIHYYDEFGQHTFCEDGYSIVKNEYDRKGRCIRESFYDVKGKPIFCNLGFHGINTKYDGDNFLLQMSIFDLNGEIIVGSNDFSGVAYQDFSVFKNHDYYSFTREFYDKNYQKSKECNILTYQSRDRREEVITTYYDFLGFPRSQGYNSVLGIQIVDPSTYASEAKRYQNENLVSICYLDAYGNQAVNEDGIGYIEYSYNNGNLTKITFYDTSLYSKRKIKFSEKQGFSERELRYDKNRNLSKRKDYTMNGILEYYFEYDERGNVIKCTYDSEGYKNTITMNYDKCGNLLKKVNLKENKEFYAEYNLYNERYQKIKSEYFYSGQFSYCIETKYNEYGRIIEEVAFDENHNLVEKLETKCARIKYDYDAKQNILNVAYYNLNDKQENITFKYDEKNNMIRMSFFDEKGNPFVFNNYAAVSFEYNNDNQVISVLYLDENNKLTKNIDGVYGVIFEYNDKKKIIEKYIDSSREPMNSYAGYCMTKIDYNNNKISNYSFFDSDNHSVEVGSNARIKLIELEPFYTVYLCYDKNDTLINSFVVHYGIVEKMDLTKAENIIIEYNGQKGVMDKEGNIIIPFEYEYIWFNNLDFVYECENKYEEEICFDVHGNIITK